MFCWPQRFQGYEFKTDANAKNDIISYHWYTLKFPVAWNINKMYLHIYLNPVVQVSKDIYITNWQMCAVYVFRDINFLSILNTIYIYNYILK